MHVGPIIMKAAGFEYPAAVLKTTMVVMAMPVGYSCSAGLGRLRGRI